MNKEKHIAGTRAYVYITQWKMDMKSFSGTYIRPNVGDPTNKKGKNAKRVRKGWRGK